MSLPVTKVEIGLTLAGVSEPPFKLDSSVDGVLGEDKIAGLAFFDVSQYVQSVTVTRGRSKQLDYFQSGSAVVNFNNIGREFDPLNTDSPYYPEIKPRRLIRITTADVPVFYGFVNDWDVEYDLAGNNTAVAFCSDMFSVLANMKLSVVTPSAELSGARVNYVLDRPGVSYTGGREISAGESTLGAYEIAADTNVLNYLRQVERSEQGSLFVSADGNMVFRDRAFVSDAPVVFADDGSGIGYSSLSNEYGDELLYNRIVVTSPAGATVVKSDTNSILEFQISELAWEDLLNSTTAEVTSIAEFLLNKFANPRLRFTGISLELSGKETVDVENVLRIELADYVELVKSFDVGLPASITQLSFMAGISHQIRPDSHRVIFSIESLADTALLILGDSLYGKLDEFSLSF